MYQTNMYEGLLAETVIMPGHSRDRIHAYMARPLGSGPYPGMVLLHHAPGWDEWYREGHTSVCSPRLCHHLPQSLRPGRPWDSGGCGCQSAGGGRDPGRPGDRRCRGGSAYIDALPYSTGKVGIFGTCSGGRQTFLTGCSTTGFDAAIECWGAEWCRPRKS